MRVPSGLTPIQLGMAYLSGDIAWLGLDSASDELRQKLLRNGRDGLVASTYVDFQYDLQKWHDYLQQSERHHDEYNFSFLGQDDANRFHERIMSMANDPTRQRILSLEQATTTNDRQ